MSKITGLDRPNDLLIKLLREGSRLRFETDDNNRIDHFFNFSVTAHSLRDWCAEDLYSRSSDKTLKALKKEIDSVCDTIVALSVAKDIANSVKHFNISRYVPDVKAANSSLSKQVLLVLPSNSTSFDLDIALDNFGREKIVETPSFEIVFIDDSKMGLDEYIISTVMFWIGYFDQNSIYRDPSYDASFAFFPLVNWPSS
ncbi:hypothetical protein [Zhongshania sp.]|jgi:hypothetical protein|uniref:hypothetical protein n=1 Tax=Zhongshania sp. TaxID=1971902 RepID=UPI002A80B628|nr:hypothetical protein [Zhongshania sp.]